MFDSRKKVVVTDWEVGESVHAVQGAALLLDLLVTHQLANDDQEREAPRAAVAVLNLATQRLRDFQRALRGDLDPAQLLADFNTLPDAPDLHRNGLHVLRPWTRETHPAPTARSSPAPKPTTTSKRRAR